MAAINRIVRFGLPDDYWDTYADRVNALSLDDVAMIAKKFITPHEIVWVVVGDAAKIKADLEALDFDDIRMITSDGDLVTGE